MIGRGEWKVVWSVDSDGKKSRPATNEIQSLTFFPKKGRFSWQELNTEGTFTIDPSQSPASMVFHYGKGFEIKDASAKH